MSQSLEKKRYRRFSPAQRLEHLVLLVAFGGLAVTGLPQKYTSNEDVRWLVERMGGIENLRIVHRIFAVTLMVLALYHLLTISYKLYVLGKTASLAPRRRDFRDLWDWVRYNLRLSDKRPRMPYYNFSEKLDYWVIVTSMLLMILTGLVLWKPSAATDILPGQLVPASRVIHSEEALLIVLFVLIWHLYGTLIKQLNLSIWTGTMSHQQMLREHAEALDGTEAQPARSAHDMESRRQRFMVVSVIVSVILVGGIAWYLTREQTAITTVVRQEAIIFAPDFQIEEGDPAVGAALWPTVRCARCHGDDAVNGLENTPPALNTNLSFPVFFEQVRLGRGDMPPIGREEISDRFLLHIWAWLRNDAEQTADQSQTN
jgi:cytochrome b subunit of formate dehydrogenase